MSPAAARYRLSAPDPKIGDLFMGIASTLDEAMGRPGARRIEDLDDGSRWARNEQLHWEPADEAWKVLDEGALRLRGMVA